MDTGQVPEFELHDVTVKLAIMYEKILEYLKLQLSAKCDHLRVTNPQNPRTMAKQILVCKAALVALLYKDGWTITLPTSNFYLLRENNKPK